MIYDRNGKVIADNVIGYSVSVLAQREDTLRAVLQRLTGTINITPHADRAGGAALPPRADASDGDHSRRVVRRRERARGAPLAVSRADHPELAAPLLSRRADRRAVRRLHGRDQRDRAGAAGVRRLQGGPAGRQAGAREGSTSPCCAARKEASSPRWMRAAASCAGRAARAPTCRRWPRRRSTRTSTSTCSATSPASSATRCRAARSRSIRRPEPCSRCTARRARLQPLHRRRAGGVLRFAPHRPATAALQQGAAGQYPPGSTWKLATTVVGLETGAVTMSDHMPIPCTGGMQYGNRYFRCWDKRGHGSLDLQGAIAKSCDVYFYQLGLKLGLARLLAGGVSLGMDARRASIFPRRSGRASPRASSYFNRQYGRELEPVGRAQHGHRAGRQLADHPEHGALLHGARHRWLGGQARDRARQAGARADREAHAPSSSTRCAPRSSAWWRAERPPASAIKGVQLAGKTGTAQSGTLDATGKELNHAWFVGFAPAERSEDRRGRDDRVRRPRHARRAIASAIIANYLKVTPVVDLDRRTADGDASGSRSTGRW